MALCVILPETSLHIGPGFQYPESSWKLHPYTPLRKVDTWNDWYHVADVDGDLHWVHTSRVIEGTYCLTIKVDKTFLRRGPGEHYTILMDAKKYESFRFVGRRGKWSQVANEQGEGFWLLTSATWVQ